MPVPQVIDGRPRPGAPRWWAADPDLAGSAALIALAPAEVAFRAAAGIFHAAHDLGLLRGARAAVPVVSVGNLTVGGSGKTPFARWLVSQLRARGRRPAVLHGGYADDEPALHRAWHPDVPVVVGRDRLAGAEEAIGAGADVIVLDDGFQHRRLARDLDIVLVPAESWTRRPRLLPRGPWRESPPALGRADVVAVTRKTASRGRAAAVLGEAALLAPRAARAIVALHPRGWRHGATGEARAPERAVVAVSGIADPAAFVEHAEGAGADVAEILSHPDHHAYSRADVQRIERIAEGRPVVTTEKDWVKLAPLAAEIDVFVLEQEVVVEHGAAELEARLDALTGAGA